MHFRAAGERVQRATQLWRWLYRTEHLVESLHETAGLDYGFSPAFRQAAHIFSWAAPCTHQADLSMPCRAQGDQQLRVDGGLRLSSVVSATDGTRKLLFELTVRLSKAGPALPPHIDEQEAVCRRAQQQGRPLRQCSYLWSLESQASSMPG